jgi:hypothetical protein
MSTTPVAIPVKSDLPQCYIFRCERCGMERPSFGARASSIGNRTVDYGLQLTTGFGSAPCMLPATGSKRMQSHLSREGVAVQTGKIIPVRVKNGRPEILYLRPAILFHPDRNMASSKLIH